MQRQSIPYDQLKVQVIQLWDSQWFALCAGDLARKQYNAMTVAWGSLGTMWSRPFVQVVVRPTRYTFQFMERYPTFTLCAFPETKRAALQILGSTSGRDGDKIASAGLTPIAATAVAAPAFDEAELILECQKIYWDDFKATNFLDPTIEKNYPRQDYHRIYFGELKAIWGTAQYRK